MAPARNLELKVRCSPEQFAAIRSRALARCDNRLSVSRQVDTYFAVPTGRLKLREIVPADGAASAELIAYDRPDEDGPRWSRYRRVPIPISEAMELRTALSETIGVAVVVAKTREVAIHGRTRIHLDVVDGLGPFVELETVVADEDDAVADHELAAIVDALGLGPCATIAGSYADVLSEPGGTDEDRHHFAVG